MSSGDTKQEKAIENVEDQAKEKLEEDLKKKKVKRVYLEHFKKYPGDLPVGVYFNFEEMLELYRAGVPVLDNVWSSRFKNSKQRDELVSFVGEKSK